ncbi:MAG: VOC family protein, partial [Thermoleophilia bacterium]|nr:VOC family protein [Thermoleophilia bacterium]
PERAVNFYSAAFGWKISKREGDQPYWLFETGPDEEPGINGGITLRAGSNTTVNTIGVSDLDDAINRVQDAGGKVISEKLEIPDVGIMAYCQDTEGNPFGIIQPEPAP